MLVQSILNIKVTNVLALIIGPISFLWNIFYYTSTVRGQQECDFSIPGRLVTQS